MSVKFDSAIITFGVVDVKANVKISEPGQLSKTLLRAMILHVQGGPGIRPGWGWDRSKKLMKVETWDSIVDLCAKLQQETVRN